MSRHRFRSQPALQRSGGGRSWALFTLGLIAAAGIGLGAVVGAALKGVAPEPDRIRPQAPIDEPATSAAPPPQVAQAPPAPVTVPAAAAQALASSPPSAPIAHTRTATLVRAMRKLKPKPSAASAEPARPGEAQWEEQRRDYDRARAAYDASERAEGYRWAQQNRIRVERYCRVAEQRTAAFVEGCERYVRAAPAGGRDRSAPPSPDQG